MINNEWCIKITLENRRMLEDWRLGQPNPQSYHCYDPAAKWLLHTGYVSWGNNYQKKEITTEEFKKYVLKLEKMEVEKLAFKNLDKKYREQFKEMIKKDYGKVREEYFEEYYAHYPLIYGGGCFYNEIQDGYKLATEEQIKILFNDMDKKLIGYKLIKPEYVEAACKIEGYRGFGTYISNGETILIKETKIILDRTASFKRLEDAGVLSLWFEAVYEDEFKVGDWVYTNSIGVTPTEEIDNTKSGGTGFVANTLLKIRTITESYYHTGNKVYWFENHSDGIWEGNFRKATQKEIDANQKIVLNLSTEVIVSKNKVNAAGKTINIASIDDLYVSMIKFKSSLPWDVAFDTVNIGCSTFTRVDLYKILEAYDKINGTAFTIPF